MRYDPNESMFPPIGEPIRIRIVSGEERQSAKGRDMLLLETTVLPDQPGAGFDSKFYALSFHIGDIMRAVGMDASGPRDVDAETFRDMEATVIFKQEKYTNRDGEDKTATKIDQWIVAEVNQEQPPPVADDGPDDESRQPPTDSSIPF